MDENDYYYETYRDMAGKSFIPVPITLGDVYSALFIHFKGEQLFEAMLTEEDEQFLLLNHIDPYGGIGCGS